MEFLIDGELVDEADVTDEQWWEIENDYQSLEPWVDPMEIEEPVLNSESGFDNEFLRDCD